MAETTISWTHTRAADGRVVPGYTFNPWIGCQKVSPACDGCYAEHLMATRLHRVEWGPHGERKRTTPGYWHQPTRWNAAAAAAGVRPFVFCASLADVFDNQVPRAWRRDLFELIRATPHLVWLLLTKRPQNILEMAAEAGGLPANAALGTTIEDQKRADMNARPLDDAKRELRPLFTFTSCEPLLGPITIPIDLMPDWIITGGETDQGEHKARPTHPYWLRLLRDQAAAAGAEFHHKQNGEWLHMPERAHFKDVYDEPWRRVDSAIRGIRPALMFKVGKHHSGRLLDGVLHDAHPIVPALHQEPAHA